MVSASRRRIFLAFVGVANVLLAFVVVRQCSDLVAASDESQRLPDGTVEVDNCANIAAGGDDSQQQPRAQSQVWKVTPFKSGQISFDAFYSLSTKFDSLKGFTVDEQQRLQELNRYSDIMPTHETTVTLGRNTGDKVDNYINANFVNGKDYIATQGPLSNTIGDFWLMVFEQDVSVIVMVTGVMEGGRVKCERYWPADVGNKSRLTTKDGIGISMLSTDEHDHDRSVPYVRSELLLEHGSTSRKVHHFWYNTWPDHGVPVDKKGNVEWRGATDMLSSIHAEEMPGPWLVHCSAGIGRTGTFIGIDMGQQRLQRDGKVDTLELIKEMREGRGGMVQTFSQAQFMQSALLGFAEHHNHAHE